MVVLHAEGVAVGDFSPEYVEVSEEDMQNEMLCDVLTGQITERVSGAVFLAVQIVNMLGIRMSSGLAVSDCRTMGV